VNLAPSFNAWELAVGAGIGAAIIAGTGWEPVLVLVGAALAAIITGIRSGQWPVAVGVMFALWAFHTTVQPVIPDLVNQLINQTESTLAGTRTTANP
jgi:hypothetical protein